MNGNERRKALVELLMSEEKPLSGGMLARRLCVSRQVIVQDIALLKADGYEILSTHYGYVLQKTTLVERVFKVKHTSAQTEEELSLIVSLGGTVANMGNITYSYVDMKYFTEAMALKNGVSGIVAFLASLLGGVLLERIQAAGNTLFGDAGIGEYFRVFIVYGIIALAIVLHAAKKAGGSKKK